MGSEARRAPKLAVAVAQEKGLELVQISAMVWGVELGVVMVGR